MEKSCGECKWWQKLDLARMAGKDVVIGQDLPNIGQCRRYSPRPVTPVAAIERKQLGAQFNFQGGASVFPVTDGDRDWCGEHEARLAISFVEEGVEKMDVRLALVARGVIDLAGQYPEEKGLADLAAQAGDALGITRRET